MLVEHEIDAAKTGEQPRERRRGVPNAIDANAYGLRRLRMLTDGEQQ